MRSLSGALRFGHPEGAARPARGGRGRSADLARLVRRGCQQRPASHRASRHPRPARGSGPHRGRPGHPPAVCPRQPWLVPAALCARGDVPEPRGPPAPGGGLRWARPGAGPSRYVGECGRAPRARGRRTLSPGTRTSA